MNPSHGLLAKKLASHLVSLENLSFTDQSEQKVQIRKPNNEIAVLDLTPFIARPQAPDAAGFFSGVKNITDLEQAYRETKKCYTFEEHLPEAMVRVSEYAGEFISQLFINAREIFTDTQARCIADFVKQLDVYTAVKSVESFLYSKADMKLLEIADHYSWHVHYDHMAIRCGTQAYKDAERIAELLKSEHGYVASQVEGEAFYQFADGWNAYPLYKILTNGQILRVFIDQSDGTNPNQIIQHWNRVYGYTAHHLGIRATSEKQAVKLAVPLQDIVKALAEHGVSAMEPTGMYTLGLLQQVFSKPEKNRLVPQKLKTEIAVFGSDLSQAIENAKLLEIVSRKEMPLDLAQELFALYGLEFDVNNPLHSAPVYQYFLPAQAAHVIKTSTQIV